jgi:hypothetical protein
MTTENAIFPAGCSTKGETGVNIRSTMAFSKFVRLLFRDFSRRRGNDRRTFPAADRINCAARRNAASTMTTENAIFPAGCSTKGETGVNIRSTMADPIIYLDVIWLLNFCFDSLLLLLTAFILKRQVKKRRVCFSLLFHKYKASSVGKSVN